MKDCLLNMSFQLFHDQRFLADQGNLVLVAETSVIEVGRRDGENFLVDDQQLGVEIMRGIKEELDVALVHHTKILIPENVHHPHIRMLWHDHLYINPTLCCIHQCFPQQKAGKKIRGLDQHATPGTADKLCILFLQALKRNGGNVPYNLVILKLHVPAVTQLVLDVIGIEGFKILLEYFPEGRGDLPFETEYKFPPVEVVSGDVRGADVGDLVVDYHDLTVIAAVSAGEQIGADLDLFKKLHLPTQFNQFSKKGL